MIVSGVSEGDILSKWTFGEVAKVDHLRKDNYYNGVNHGEDFTALAIYLHQHTPTEHKGKRWKQTKSIQQPVQEKTKQVERVYSPERPPKAPKVLCLSKQGQATTTRADMCISSTFGRYKNR